MFFSPLLFLPPKIVRNALLLIYLLIVALGKAVISATDWRSGSRLNRVRVYTAGLGRKQRIFVTEKFQRDHRRAWHLLRSLVGNSSSKWALLSASEPGCAVLSDDISLATFVRCVRRLDACRGLASKAKPKKKKIIARLV